MAKQSLGIIKTVNNEYGNNPTINQIYKIEVDLPKISNNIPSLNCFVEDFYLRYFKENLGNFEINLKDCYLNTKIKFEEIHRKFDDLTKFSNFLILNFSKIKNNKQTNYVKYRNLNLIFLF